MDTHIIFWLVTGFLFVCFLVIPLFLLCKCLLPGFGLWMAVDAPGSEQIAHCRNMCVNRIDAFLVFRKLGKTSLSITSYKFQISRRHGGRRGGGGNQEAGADKGGRRVQLQASA